MRQSISVNGRAYRVLDVVVQEYHRVRPGTIERALKGIPDPHWLLTRKRYLITAKARQEDFTRTFVFSEREYEKLLKKD